MNTSTLIIGLLIGSVVITVGSMIMTMINLGFYFDRGSRGRPDQGQSVGGAMPARVAVCIPARNEEENIEQCVRSVLESEHADLRVLVYDDQSTDSTPQILEGMIERDPRIIRVETRELPPGWVGKQWACERLGRSALDHGADWLLFTDADVRFGPRAVTLALDAARRLRADLVSTFPLQLMGTLAERLLVPMIHFVLFSYLPMGRMRGSSSPAASAGCGQFMFISAAAYRAIGGHESWRDSMHDGIRMPRAVRRAGLHSDLFHVENQARCRMYRGLAQTWRGFAKNAYEGLGNIGLLVFLTLLHVAGHILPWIVLIGGVFHEPWRGPAWILAFVSCCVACGQRWVLARHFSQPAVGILLHPLAVLLMIVIQWHSFVLHTTGRRTWRDRLGAA